jgi:hypothetical protein
MFPNSGGISYIMHSIEFQKRGLPHAHILVRYNRPCITPADIDAAVSAELPTDAADRSIVESFMIHRHGDATNPSSYCQRDGKPCRFKFPRPVTPSTTISSTGRVNYRRRNGSDVWVVPYNLNLLRVLRCHINFEAANTSALFQYLFKYVYKGLSLANHPKHNRNTDLFPQDLIGFVIDWQWKASLTNP